MFKIRCLAGLLHGSLVLLALGCGGDDANDDANDDAGAGEDAGNGGDAGVAAQRCVADSLAAQPSARFPVGRTFYLPAVDMDEDDCADAHWRLTQAPDANQNDAVAGADGFERFTPHVAGRYAFELGDTGTTAALVAVKANTQTFINYNYAPASSLARVGDQVWVADVLRPSITRIHADGKANLGTIDVGGWPVALAHREGMEHVLVAQRADDSVGLVSVKEQRIVDAIWVGDEPASIILSEDGATAYVTLATEGAVAVIDVEARAVERRIETPADPYGIALGSDGKTLIVAGHRSGQSEQSPFPDADPKAELDIAIIDLESGDTTKELLDIGTTIGDVLAAPDGSGFYFTRILNPAREGSAQAAGESWVHEVAFYDFAADEVSVSADVGRQDSSAGFAVTLQAMTLFEDELWVVAESSDLVLRLDPDTLEERGRVEAGGRPRHILALEDQLLVHGHQGQVITRISAGDFATDTIDTIDDPRSEAVARGQYHFTGTGDLFGENHGCNSCHADGLSDGVVWAVGSGDEHNVPRPLFWLEGTRPLGWGGYMSSARNFGYETQINIGRRPDTDQASNTAAYLESLAAPPAANGHTRRDGALSDEALRGKQIFDGDGGCAGCHTPPLFTNKALFDPAVTVLPSDVPSLVGAYRMPAFLKTGEAANLEEALDRMLEFLETEMDDDDRASVLRYLRELTGRDFFVLRGPDFDPRALPVDVPLELVLSLPAHDDEDNLARVELLDAYGEVVEADVEARGDRLIVTPREQLAFERAYELRIAGDFESQDQRSVTGTRTFALETAAEPTVTLEPELIWTVALPGIDMDDGSFTEELSDVRFAMAATPAASGVRIDVDYGAGLEISVYAVIEGKTLHLPALPVAAGPAFVDGTPSALVLVDEDGDGVAEGVDGTIKLAGPGLSAQTDMRVEPGTLMTGGASTDLPGTGEGTLGDACTENGQCSASAPYCALMPGAAEGFCTTTGCQGDDDCEPDWTCFDLSVFLPGADPFCNRPAQ